MRVLLIGPARTRDRLRGELIDSPIEVIGEVTSEDEARASGLLADALLSAFSTVGRDRTDTAGDEAVAESLTPRELQVLEFLAEGFANRAIAERLGISDQTVKFHVAAIIGKLGASNRTEAVRRAVRRGLVSL